MRKQVELCAKALKSAGLQPGECVTIALPNCPQALCLFYAVNLAGGVVSMIHPLSSEREIQYYLQTSRSVMVVTLDQLFGKFKNILVNTEVRLTIVTGIQDGLAFPKNVAYKMTAGRSSYVNSKVMIHVMLHSSVELFSYDYFVNDVIMNEG